MSNTKWVEDVTRQEARSTKGSTRFERLGGTNFWEDRHGISLSALELSLLVLGRFRVSKAYGIITDLFVSRISLGRDLLHAGFL